MYRLIYTFVDCIKNDQVSRDESNMITMTSLTMFVEEIFHKFELNHCF